METRFKTRLATVSSSTRERPERFWPLDFDAPPVAPVAGEGTVVPRIPGTQIRQGHRRPLALAAAPLGSTFRGLLAGEAACGCQRAPVAVAQPAPTSAPCSPSGAAAVWRPNSRPRAGTRRQRLRCGRSSPSPSPSWPSGEGGRRSWNPNAELQATGAGTGEAMASHRTAAQSDTSNRQELLSQLEELSNVLRCGRNGDNKSLM
ncbi:uncharacterized protein [Gorilla gorilla gorilla]|uniref:uncharacterized protein n=1 Tax=Gorilla gorilla gorilla TaxID=9595 RepID=UPI002445A4D1|nr:uncharacterized protein LOC129530473 [Gorilla gorilla gorilla]XP_055233305.1 uncharacterized protein LOC129530554 [Gorilla gorilla gorilla]